MDPGLPAEWPWAVLAQLTRDVVLEALDLTYCQAHKRSREA